MTPGEKARESWNGVFSRYSAAPALLLRLRHGVADAALDVHVDEDAGRAHFFRIGNQAAAIAVGAVLEHGEGEVAGLCRAHFDAEHRGVEAARAREVGDRQVEPDDAIGTRVHLAHFG